MKVSFAELAMTAKFFIGQAHLKALEYFVIRTVFTNKKVIVQNLVQILSKKVVQRIVMTDGQKHSTEVSTVQTKIALKAL